MNAPMPTPAAQELPAFTRERCLVITRRFPSFALGWLGVTALWILMLAVEAHVEARWAVAVLVFQALVTGGAILVQRWDPAVPRVRVGTLAALAAFGLSWLAFMVAEGGKALFVETLLLALWAAAGAVFAFGWRAQLVLIVATLGPTLLASGRLEHLTSSFQSAAFLSFGAAACLGIAEISRRRAWAIFRHRVAEEQARLALALSRDAYRELAETARDHIWTADRESRLTYINAAGADFMGVPAETLIGQPIDALIADHMRAPRAIEVVARLATGETLPPLLVQVEVGSRPAWFETMVAPIYAPDGKLAGMRGISRNVTDRVLAEQRTRESEDRFRLAFAQTSVGMTITDRDGRAVQLNQAICDMLGYSHAELMEMSIGDVTHPDDLAPTLELRGRLLRGDADSLEIEKRFVRRDGMVVWGHVTISLARSPAGEPRYFVALVQDVTHRRQAIAALRASEEKLRRLAVGQEAIREAERKRLGLDLHDDVCQELVGVGILIASVRRRLDPAAPGYDDLGRGIGYLNEVVEYLRNLAHELRPLHLRDLGLESSLRSLADGMSSAETRVRLHIPGAVPRLDEGTEVGVYRITQEAITNALRHGRARGVDVTLAVDDGALTLEVRDDGIGFDVRDGGGDLGLVGIEERALALGGSAAIRSEVGVGTTVLLRCPIGPLVEEKRAS